MTDSSFDDAVAQIRQRLADVFAAVRAADGAALMELAEPASLARWIERCHPRHALGSLDLSVEQYRQSDPNMPQEVAAYRAACIRNGAVTHQANLLDEWGVREVAELEQIPPVVIIRHVLQRLHEEVRRAMDSTILGVVLASDDEAYAVHRPHVFAGQDASQTAAMAGFHRATAEWQWVVGENDLASLLGVDQGVLYYWSGNRSAEG